jgi:hypothetical protein
MIELKRFSLHGGVFVLALTAVALLASLLLRPLLEPNFFLFFLAAVWLSAWYYGRAGGLLSTLLAGACVLYFFLPPVYSAAALRGNVLARLLSFVLVALLITWVTSGWRGGRALLAATLSSIGDGVAATDKEGRITFLNPVAEGLTGWSDAEARGKPLATVLRLISEGTREEIENLTLRALRAGSAVHLTDRVLLLSKDGTEIPIEDSAAPIRDETGTVRGVILVFRDVSRRRQLEEQLTQSQKMEAVGRLAGGVAGDFNNVLTVITGYSELLRVEISAGSPLRRFADEILYAAERAAALTRQLLAFSHGQTAQPKLLDLNAILAAMEPMLRRLLGENIDLITLGGTNLGKVKADPGQIEQIIVNLAANARDAMPNGGKLVLETANVDLDDVQSSKKIGIPPGSYVMLAVSDTGVGMDAETRSRVFEPFFTTKEPGKGSGLGLSTAYGMVKQSQGHITVYTQLGCGTIFEIYLPRVTEVPAGVPVTRKLGTPKGSETILLVDDEEGVRKLVHAILHGNGYTVIEAANGSAALAAFEKNAHKVDMVLTDVVMPQMNGFELGERLLESNPELKVLFMSGYRDHPIARPEGEPNRAFLHKPFTPDGLLGKVREVLDAQVA